MKGIPHTSCCQYFFLHFYFIKSVNQKQKLTEWNLIVPFYVFSHSLKELEMCDDVIQKQAAEGRKEKQRVGTQAYKAISPDCREAVW